MNTTKRTEITKHTSLQELIPLLRTGDVVTIHNNQGKVERNAEVWVSDHAQSIMAGSYCLRNSDGTINSDVEDVVLQFTWERIAGLGTLAASLDAGDVVRATFVFVGSPAITLEGIVETDQDGDAFLIVEDEDGDASELYHITLFGRVSRRLRALEVVHL